MSHANALDTLRTELLDGFRDARVPTTTDEIADDLEVREVRDLVGKHWTEIPFETLFLMRWDLNWFERMGIRQYLPAFMLASVRNTELAELVIKYLADDVGEREALWPDEKRAVRAWLRHMRDERANEDAAAALATYWEDPPIKPLDEERVVLFRRARDVFAPACTAAEVRELAAAVLAALENGSAYLRQISVAAPYTEAERMPVARSMSAEQLALIVDFLEYARRRWPDAGDDVNLRFWREQLAGRVS